MILVNSCPPERFLGTIHLSDVTPGGVDIPDWTFGPTVVPSASPTSIPSAMPSDTPSGQPSLTPRAAPSDEPSMIPITIPSALPSRMPSNFPSPSPSLQPSTIPSVSPLYSPTGRARNQTMVFIRPLGDEELIAETQTNIAWESLVEEIDVVYLEYSLDEEESWINMADDIPNTGSYVWTVPNQYSDRVKIRVLGRLRRK
mmetsp:Transcript_3280/g.5032  ORF Transcript_3280/g.5032 Transcript_3280/m.5032 type:complete len:200 (+) Transcript_3280:168-767(+)